MIAENYNRFVSYVKEYRKRVHSANYYKNFEQDKPGDYNSIHGFDYYKCIFIHIPKTGGNSVSQALFGNLAMSHMGYDWYVKKMGVHTVGRYFKFCFVRNPWDRLYSAYRYLKSGGMNEQDASFSKSYLDKISSFEEFVMSWLNDETVYSYWHLIPQTHYISSRKDRAVLTADFIGRFESLENDFEEVCRRLNRTALKLPHLNSNADNKGVRSYRDVYTSEMVKKVERLYENDVRLLNYSF